MKAELTIGKFHFSRGDQALVGHKHRMKLAIKIVTPEMQKFIEHGKARRDIIFLPDIGLQQLGMIGHVIENLCRG